MKLFKFIIVIFGILSISAINNYIICAAHAPKETKETTENFDEKLIKNYPQLADFKIDGKPFFEFFKQYDKPYAFEVLLNKITALIGKESVDKLKTLIENSDEFINAYKKSTNANQEKYYRVSDIQLRNLKIHLKNLLEHNRPK